MNRLRRSGLGGARLSDDDGQTVTFVVVFLMLAIILVGVRWILPMGEATDKRSRAQVAADAAALAAAGAVADRLAHRWADGLGPGRWGDVGLDCGGVNAAAQDLADANGARVVGGVNCSNATGEPEVLVELDAATEDGRHARATARASLGIAWSTCQWRPPTVPTLPPPPTTTTAPTTTTTAPTTTTTTTTRPPPPPVVDATLKCGSLEVAFRWDWDELKFFPRHLTYDNLRKKLKPRLVG